MTGRGCVAQVRNREAVARDSLGRKSQVENKAHLFESQSDERNRHPFEQHMPLNDESAFRDLKEILAIARLRRGLASSPGLGPSL